MSAITINRKYINTNYIITFNGTRGKDTDVVCDYPEGKGHCKYNKDDERREQCWTCDESHEEEIDVYAINVLVDFTTSIITYTEHFQYAEQLQEKIDEIVDAMKGEQQ